MSINEINNSREFTAWARLESSNITPLGDADGTIAVLSAILSENSPEKLIAEDSSFQEDLVLIAEEVLRLRVARLNINRRSLKRLIESPVQAIILESVWLKLRLSSLPSSSARQIPVRSQDLSERLYLISATLAELPKFSAFINLVFDRCMVSAEDIVETINKHLPSRKESSLPYANVIDVGQGGMVTVQQTRPCAMPKLFFDFGWPLRTLIKTAPKAPSLRLVGDAPVVLTHWDYDHFAFALDDVNSNAYKWRCGADERVWLVPGIGVNWGDVMPSVTGIIWALHLFVVGKLQVWPHSVAGITRGFVTIAKTVPYKAFKGDANQHGLFMLLHERVPTDYKANFSRPVAAIMIPGDADYQAIKRALYPNLTEADPFPTGTFDWKGLVATHHGGDYSFAFLPSTTPPKKKRHAPKGILAISVGQTHYGHPTVLGQQAYLINGGWRQHTLTFNRRYLGCDFLCCLLCSCNCNSPQYRGTIELTLDDRRTHRACKQDWQAFQ